MEVVNAFLASDREPASIVKPRLNTPLNALYNHFVLPLDSVQHLHSRVTARLRPRRGLLDAVAALHPTPAIAGAPRGAALAALRGRELFARGWYGGGVGWLDASGGEVAVVIRTALVRGTRATLFAGAGIVAGSDWRAELEETRLKMRPLLAALLEL